MNNIEEGVLANYTENHESGHLGVNYQWGHPTEYDTSVYSDPRFQNLQSIETVVSVFRCPSLGLPEHQHDVDTFGWHVMQRVPASYIASGSGLIEDQDNHLGNSPVGAVPMGEADGVMFAYSKVTFSKITDGTSHTMLVGEAVHDANSVELGAERAPSGRKDHWYFGSDDLDGRRDISEAVGSTAVPMNFQAQFEGVVDPCTTLTQKDCSRLQLCFGSAHSGGCQIARCDGSVDFVEEDVDALVWRDLATRASQVPTQSASPR
jgi:hypothetical protein